MSYDENKRLSGNVIKTREFRENYVLPLDEPIDVIEDQYRAGIKDVPYGSNTREFPYRSIIRGDYESKHFGSISWAAIDKFKKHLLDVVLSGDTLDENNKEIRVKLPYDLWKKTLDKYIEVQLDIIESERQRYKSFYEYHWANGYYDHDFLSGQVNVPFNYTRRWGDYYNNRHNYYYGKILLEDKTEISSEDGSTQQPYTYKTPVFYNPWYWNEGRLPYANGDNVESLHYRLGYTTEFDLFMPEYHRGNHGRGSSISNISIQTGTDPETGDPIFTDFFNYNNYGGNYYSDSGMLDDIEHLINNLKEIKYDYSNLDDCLTKNWLYIILNTPNISTTEDFPAAINGSTWPYINEVYLYEKDEDTDQPKSILADVWSGFVIDLNPPEDYDPDMIVKDWWKTRQDHQGNIDAKEKWSSNKQSFGGDAWGSGQQYRPFTADYQFNERQLIYRPTSNPLVHNEKDPRIISGVEYVFETTNGQPNEIFSDETGLRFFMLGSTTDRVYQYSLSKNWDLGSPIQYDGLYYELPPTDRSPSGIWWATEGPLEGRRYWVISKHSDTIHQYDTTRFKWDVPSTYNNISFDVTEQDKQPEGITFKPDGRKMYVAGQENSKIYQYEYRYEEYNLQVLEDSSGVKDWNFVYSEKDLNVFSQDKNPTQIVWKPDGLKLYMIGEDTSTVYQYNAFDEWEIDTMTYSGISFSVQAQEKYPQSFFFDSEGTRLYILGTEKYTLFQYDLSSPYDITSAVYNNKYIKLIDIAPTGVFFKPDGKRFYIVGSRNDYLYSYDIEVAWELPTYSEGLPSHNFDIRSKKDVSEQEGGPQGLEFSKDGKRMYTINNTSDLIEQFDIPLGTLEKVIPQGNFNVSQQSVSPTGIDFRKTGKMMYIVGPDQDKVFQYQIDEPWDVRTARYLTEYDLKPLTPNHYPTDVRLSDNGKYMYVTDLNTDSIHQFELEQPWMVDSAKQLTKFKFRDTDQQPQGFFFKPDGTKMFMLGTAQDTLYEYILETPWMIDTMEYSLKFFKGTSNQESSTRAVAFSAPPKIFSMVPMRLRVEAEKEIRNSEKVLIMDSNAYEIESKIDETRDKMLPTILDRRYTYYDDNAKLTPDTNEITIFYNENITREF